VLSAVKGTPDYTKIIDLLLQHNYAHQKDASKDALLIEANKETDVAGVPEAEVATNGFSRD
jgi:hypothetical protein